MRSDEDDALDVQRGNQAGLERLVERHHGPLIGFLYRMTGGDRALAQDLVQETFLRVMHGIHSYQYPRPFKPWLYRIATNIARDYFKRADHRRAAEFPDDDRLTSDERPEETVVHDDEERRVARALARLPEHQREVVILRYQQELSLVEISEALHIPVGTVKSRLSIGLERLRAMIGE